MAKRRPIPPYLTLPDETVQSDPVDGWELIVDGQSDRLILDKDIFPSWDSTLRFKLRRRFHFDPPTFADHLGIPSERASYQFTTRLETAGGLFSEVVDRRTLGNDDNCVELEIAPDSRNLSKVIALACSISTIEVVGDVDPLSPAQPGSRVWLQTWSAKLEGGRVRLPVEAISFSKQMPDLGIPNAFMHVSVAEYPELDFEQAVCVYINADHPRFLADFERGESTATAMVWDAAVRQVLSAGLSAAFHDEGDSLPEGSVGMQMKSWIDSIFPGESRTSISAMRQENSGLFEGKIQSWVNAGASWSEATS